MALRLGAFSTKPKKCAENNALLYQHFTDNQAMALDFMEVLMKLLDEMAAGDVYITLGTTRDKSSFTASLSVNGNRESVYEADGVSLILAFTGFLGAAFETNTDESELWDEED